MSYERDIKTVDDKVNEGDETFTVLLERRTENTQCYKIVNGTLNMTIGDNDRMWYIQYTVPVCNR